MIVVVCRGYCEKKLLEAALRNIKYLNIKILGFVMTRGSVDKSGYGKRYGKYKKATAAITATARACRRPEALRARKSADGKKSS